MTTYPSMGTRRTDQVTTGFNWRFLGALVYCFVFVGGVWYTGLVLFILLLRNLGVHVSGIWPLHQ